MVVPGRIGDGVFLQEAACVVAVVRTYMVLVSVVLLQVLLLRHVPDVGLGEDAFLGKGECDLRTDAAVGVAGVLNLDGDTMDDDRDGLDLVADEMVVVGPGLDAEGGDDSLYVFSWSHGDKKKRGNQILARGFISFLFVLFRKSS